MSQKMLIKQLVDEFGQKFSTALKIDLDSRSSEDIFKWFLAAILFGARISETIVVNTYRRFEREGVLEPDKILQTGWDGLVVLLDEGGYVRYDFKTATKLLDIMSALKREYDGDLNNLHSRARDSRDLKRRIQALGKGMGEVTTGIFLRELRGIWEKAEPLPSELAIVAARNLGLVGDRKSREKLLGELKSIWDKNAVEGKDFADFETALVRLAKDYCRKKKCQPCRLKNYCMATPE